MDKVLIIGGGSGIGKACAKKFSKDYEVIIAGIDRGQLENTAKEIKCSYIELDIRSNESIAQLDKLNNIKVLINSAGINTPNRNLENMDDEKTDDIIKTNLTGAIKVSRVILKQMRKTGGTIIHIGSTAGVKTSVLPGVAYSAAKRGLFSLVRSINLEEAKNGIRASIISPATVNTELLLKRPVVPSEEERKKVLQPETIANIAFFIATQPNNVVIEQITLTSLTEVDFL